MNYSHCNFHRSSVRHGTACGWRHHRCRCRSCHRALLAEAKIAWAVRQLRRGREPATWVSPRRMLGHPEELRGASLSADEIARRAGVAAATLSRACRRGVKISRIVEQSVLAVAVP